MRKRYSKAFVGTVYNLNDPMIDEQKQVARIMNAENRVLELRGLVKPVTYGDTLWVKRYCVVIRPRLGKNNRHAHLYRRGGPLYRQSAQTIRPEHGSRFDVYLTVKLSERKKI